MKWKDIDNFFGIIATILFKVFVFFILLFCIYMGFQAQFYLTKQAAKEAIEETRK